MNTYYAPMEIATGQVPGRLKERSVDGVVTSYRYTARGEVSEVNGATYPLKYEYDFAGRLQKLHTYRTEPGANLGENGDVTTWVYVAGTTLLQQKLDAANAGPVYGYDGNGRLHTRTWARTAGGSALTTTYTYNLAGDMSHITYSDGTPAVTLGYDALGRVASRADGSGTTSYSYYGTTGQVMDETRSDGSRLHRTVDESGREAGYSLWDGGQFATWGGWAYDGATGRMAGATTVAGWVSYAEAEGANLTSHTVALSGTNVQTEWKRDGLGRLQSLSTLVGAATPATPAGRRYQYDGAGRVGRVQEGATSDGGANWTDAGSWYYAYNGRSEVEVGMKTPGPGFNPVRLTSYSAYYYDAIGNRTSSAWGTTGWTSYPTRNALNQYVEIANAQTVPVVGEADPAKTVRVNGGVVANREGRFFGATVDAGPAADGSRPRWVQVDVQEGENGQSPTDSVGHICIPPPNEAPLHDADGNLAEDGRWTYTWDAENRLVAMESRWLNGEVPGLPLLRLEFGYDGLSRRASKTVKQYVGGNWQTVRLLRFAYEGWNLIAEWEALPLNPQLSTLNLRRSYQWGSDLSGSRQGAGGVGGLLAINTHQPNGAMRSYYPCYGDNGNIEALLDVSDPHADGTNVTVAALYEYGPFGEALRATGPMAEGNPFRFSTKYQDNETGLYYYGYRYYSATAGRWLSRDPLEEHGGKNLYLGMGNNCIRRHDALGKVDYDVDSQGFHVRLDKKTTFVVEIDPEGKWAIADKPGHGLSGSQRREAEEAFEKLLGDSGQRQKMKDAVAKRFPDFKNKDFVRAIGKNLRRACGLASIATAAYVVVTSDAPMQAAGDLAIDNGTCTALGAGAVYLTGGTVTATMGSVTACSGVGALVVGTAGISYKIGNGISGIQIGDDSVAGHLAEFILWTSGNGGCPSGGCPR